MNEEIRQKLETSFKRFELDFEGLAMQIMMIATADGVSEDDVLNYMNVKIKGELIKLEKDGTKQGLEETKEELRGIFVNLLKTVGIDIDDIE